MYSVCACVCVLCGELCVVVCMCTRNCMHTFGVSARCAVDVCSGLCNTCTKHNGCGQVVQVGAAAPPVFFNSKYLFCQLFFPCTSLTKLAVVLPLPAVISGNQRCGDHHGGKKLKMALGSSITSNICSLS